MESTDNTDIDWNKCSLCQTNTKDPLQDPNCSKRGAPQIAYKHLAENIWNFNKLGSTPIPIDHLTNECDVTKVENIQMILEKHSAKWHKKCKLKFNQKEFDRASKRKAKHDEIDDCDVYEAPKRRKRVADEVKNKPATCFFCDEEGTVGEDLHEASTFTVDMKVRDCALILEDMDLVRKLSAGDMRAQDAKYHRHCLVALYNRKRSIQYSKELNNKDEIYESIALAELIAHIDEIRADDLKKVAEIRLSDLTKLYKARLEHLKGSKLKERIHSTHLKHKIMAHFPDIEEYKAPNSNHVHLAFKDDVGLALKQAFEDRECTTVKMANCAKMIRQDIFSSKFEFDGTFGKECQINSIPPSLLAFIQMLLLGPNIRSEANVLQATKTICQIIQYNTYKRKSSTSSSARHNTDRETPLSLYIGIMIHGKTRNKDLIDTMFKLGVSVSYDRVLSVSTDIANAIIDYFENDGIVCPPSLRKGIFTIGAYDNFDHNPTSTSAKTSTHGTSISLFQEVTEDLPGEKRPRALLKGNEAKLKSIKALPGRFAIVPAAAMNQKNPHIPAIGGPMKNGGYLIQDTLKEEHRWLQHVSDILKMEVPPEDLHVTWSAFHANTQRDPSTTEFISAILPLFYEQAKSVAMVQHGMNIIKQATNLVNQEQIPVIAMDQPLFALAKKIQWDKPEEYGEDKILIMFGGFHIEIAAEKMLGDWLDGSGWTEALVQAKVTTSGTADSFLKGSHVTRTRHAHQVTAAALFHLLQKSYQDSLNDKTQQLDFQEWCNSMCTKSAQFKFWYITLDFELTLLVLVKSFRERNFMLYKDALAKLIPWCFALDHYNYSRWLSVHARDMDSLSYTHPSVANEFEAGKFSLAKTNSPFSAIAIDQAHEQNNGIMKGDGGTVGLTENPAALKRWMVAGPEMARIICEFEVDMETHHSNQQEKHHEQTPSTQRRFLREVKSLYEKLDEMGSPFLGETELYNLDTKDIASQSVIETVNSVEKLGKEQYDKFVKERLVERSVQIEAPIPKNKLAVFATPAPKVKSKSDFEKASLKSNCNLYSNLYVSCLSRGGNLSNFFQHENQAYPPSLTKLGEMRSTKKSDLVDCLLEGYEHTQKPNFDAVVLDGAAIVNMLEPLRGQTFYQYAMNTFLPYVTSYQARRVDIVWDVYLENSLKAQTREKRGTGRRRKVEMNVQVPHCWSEFLKDSKNKTELFFFLCDVITNYDCDKILVSTKGNDVKTNKPNFVNINDLKNCNHEEADTRMVVHVQHAQSSGYENVLIRTVDTDVIVIMVAMSNIFVEGELWIMFGKGVSIRNINVHTVAKSIGQVKAKGLPIFHAFTGCDNISSFSTIGKKTAWNAWKAYKEMDDVFSSIASNPTSFEKHLSKIERFVILCYNRVSNLELVNEERQYLFTKRGRDVNSIPPTQAALQQHIKRAIYQGAFCWSKCIHCNLTLPDAKEWGWKRDEVGKYSPLWTTIDEASKALQELIKCGCKKGCLLNKCKCKVAMLKCTALCVCDGSCASGD